MTTAVVVGGGISGLVAAKLLKKKFDHVIMAEAAPECGGLLRSVQDEAGHSYDQGTHIPDLTGIDEIDELVFGNAENQQKNWAHLQELRSGNYFNGRWNLETQSVSITDLDKAVRERIEQDIIDNTSTTPSANLHNYLSNRFDDFTVNKIFLPIFKKLYGDSILLEQMAADVGGGKFFLFGLERLVAFDQEIAAELKKDRIFDSKLSFHTHQEFREYMARVAPSSPGYLYPKGNNGIGVKISQILNALQQDGVEIHTSTSVAKINAEGDQIKSVVLSTHEDEINCDYLFWTVPPILALKAAGQEIVQRKVSTRCSNIFHYCLDQPLLNDQSQFLWSWDKDNPIFRITLYDNFRTQAPAGEHLITTECLSNADDANEITSNIVFEHLKKMNIVAEHSNIISRTEQRLKTAFPVPDLEFKAASEETYKTLEALYSNIGISGRFSGRVWLQSDVLRDTFNQISDLN